MDGGAVAVKVNSHILRDSMLKFCFPKKNNKKLCSNFLLVLF